MQHKQERLYLIWHGLCFCFSAFACCQRASEEDIIILLPRGLEERGLGSTVAVAERARIFVLVGEARLGTLERV